MSNPPVPLVSRMLRLEWLGQTVASLCWIVSVFLYGIEKAADVLQLVAASSWLVANVASVLKPESS
ncbi:MAG: hypothetical protein QF351_00335 [Phycisphaerales bacterium]|nr:hypothetical protein [Phycisphaerales bacterium]